ncbi:MBL fold metallo-hydrolase [Rhizobium sp. NXC24]|uniref:AidB family quorum-quenching N-acyl homoserine lactonase n=1 Tax=Rhizobium sp. NXC24 TaxID=2048897 RepID=UPI000CDF3AB0|nr:MBL fold metallo-hydrolase [Rhizobium sp. NXC24]AVA23859.1 metallo-beta-lactamase family hydrolase protein [Rhizobium sp. NXC24]
MTDSVLKFWRYEVIPLRDGFFEASSEVLTHARGGPERRRTIEAWAKTTVQMDINCFALRNAEGITLVDAGAGTSWGSTFGQARTAMREAGIAREEVQRVLLTHIHDDHVLGLFDEGTPYFPHAEVLVPEKDLAFFTDPCAWRATPEARRGGFDMAEQLQQIYGPRVRRIPEGAVLAGIEARALPGHTPGHTGYLVQGEENSNLLIWGDTLHLGELQSNDPEIGLVYDLDVQMAARTRQATLELATREHWIIAGSHLTGFGRVRRAAEGGGYQISPV